MTVQIAVKIAIGGDSAGGFDMALKSKIVIKSIGKRCDFLRKSFKQNDKSSSF